MNLISSQDLTKEQYGEIFGRARKFIDGGIPTHLCEGRVAATLFFQPSTRTMMAFQSAMLRAGGGWVGITGIKGTSIEKDESLEDMIRTVGFFSDCIVLRHPDDDAAKRAGAVSGVPVVNCGSGNSEHVFGAIITIVNFLNYIKRPLDGCKIGIYGTPEFSRVTKAMMPILGMYGVQVVIDDLGYFPLPEEVKMRSIANGLAGFKYDKLDNFVGEIDVLVVTDVLHKGVVAEGAVLQEKLDALSAYVPINQGHMKKLRRDAALTMITPRIFEIENGVDRDPRATYSKREPFTETALAVMTYLLGMQV